MFRKMEVAQTEPSPLRWIKKCEELDRAVRAPYPEEVLKEVLKDIVEESDDEAGLPATPTYKVVGRTSTEVFRKFAAEYEGHLSPWLRADGTVLIRELVGRVHGTSCDTWMQRMTEGLGDLKSLVVSKVQRATKLVAHPRS